MKDIAVKCEMRTSRTWPLYSPVPAALGGYTLIEIIIGLAIMAFLVALAMPSYQIYLQNSKARTAAESILNGLQLARAEAVRRNIPVRFQLTTSISDSCAVSDANSDVSSNWVVSIDGVGNGDCAKPPLDESKPIDHVDNPAPRIIQTRPESAGSAGALVKAGDSTVTFNGMGRLLGTPGNIQIKPPVGNCGGEVRCLCVTVSRGGQVRLCNPSLPQADSQSCYDGAEKTCEIS